MRVLPLMYHDVVERGLENASGFPGADAALYKLEHSQFEKHLDAIAARTMRDAASVLDLVAKEQRERTSQTHEKRLPFLITFDDGGVSAYELIADMLEDRGWRGHFFVTAGRIGTSAFMNLEQIRQLHDRGHIIGSHSQTHPLRMSHCHPEEMLSEWQTSIKTLSDIVGERVRIASVPGGFYSAQVAKAAAAAGIEVLFNSEPAIKSYSVDGCLVLGRYTVQRWMPPEVAAAIACGQIWPRFRQTLLWNLKKVTKSIGGEQYLKLRKLLLGQG